MMGWGRQEIGDMDEWLDGPAAHPQARRVRLPFLTWGRLAMLAAALGLGAALVGEDVESKPGVGVDLVGHRGLIETIRFAKDGRTLLTSGWDRTVRIWDTAGADSEDFGRELACLTLPGELYSAALSPDGRQVAAVGMDGLTLWDWSSENEAPRSLENVGACRTAEFSPDGRVLALTGSDKVIRLVNPATGRVRSILGSHDEVVRKMMFTPDSRTLITLSFDGRMKTWDVVEGRRVERFRGIEDPTRPVLTMALSPSGKDLAVSRFDDAGRIELWDAASGTLRVVCKTGDRESHALTFSRDGSILASAESDYRVRFWNTDTGGPIGALEGETGWVRTLDFSSDGIWVALSSVPDRVLLRRVASPGDKKLASGREPSKADAVLSRRPGNA